MANRFKQRKNKNISKTPQTFSYRPLAFAIAVAISGTLPSVANAATYTVSTTVDSGSGSLREAVSLANANPGVDTIDFSVVAGTIIDLASELLITESVTISGPTAGNAGSVILDGGGANRHINADFPSINGHIVTLENITLENGKYDSTGIAYGPLIGGGAVVVQNADLVLNHSLISNNSTTGLNNNAVGGGIHVINGDAILTLSTVSGNSTTGIAAEGGGLSVSNGNVTLTQSTLSGNSTIGYFAKGGGLSLINGNITLTQSTLSGNSTTGTNANGGGLSVVNGNVTLTQSTLSGNSSTGTNAIGGGIAVNGGYTTLKQSTVFDNHSAFGAAGLAVDLNVINTVSLTNSILSGNTNSSTGTGGNLDDAAPYAGPYVTVISSVFGDDPSEITDITNSTANQYTDNPDLGVLQNNGGSTKTHKPNSNPNSPTLDLGSNTAASAYTSDQRGSGFLRNRNDVVDIGAVELQTGPLKVSNTDDSGPGSLRQAVLDSNISSGANTIEFDLPPGSIIVLNSELEVTDSLTISGPTAGDAFSLRLNAGNANRHINAGGFSPGSGQTITLENIALSGGNFDGTAAGSGIGGGAVYVKNADLVLNNSNISNNSTMGNNASGGGILVNSGNATLNQTTVSFNDTMGSDAHGAGISIISGNFILNESTVSGNTTSGSNAYGGGLYIKSGNATLSQSTVSRNSTGGSTAEGGGLFVKDGNATLTHSTVFENNSAYGGAGLSVNLSSNYKVILTNSILSGNTNTPGLGTDGNFHDRATSTGLYVIANNSLFGDVATEITDTANSTANIYSDLPNLGFLNNNGGPTDTHLPNPSSAAINNGSNAAVIFDNDQRGIGFSRVRDGIVDIGAVETQTGAYTFSVVNTDDNGEGSLRQALIDANASPGADIIEFTVPLGSTINLNSELVITDSVTISGPTVGDAGSVILDGGNTNRHINAGGFSPGIGQTVTLENITLQNGFFYYPAAVMADNIGGGAVFVKNADLVLNHTNITNNSTLGDFVRGGGIFIRDGDVTLTQSTISGNTTNGTNGTGGGLIVLSGDVIISQSTISDNSTTGINAKGGGIFVNGGDTTLIQSTVSNNSTLGDFARGGGISVFGGDTTLTQSTIFDNHSYFGAAGLSVYLLGNKTVSLTNSILSGNTNTGTGTDGNFNETTSLGTRVTANNSLFGDDAAEITNTAYSANNQHTNNPDLGPLVDNGGPTFTHLPNLNSPALDMGNNTGASATDQRGTGFNRIINTTVDIGSVELQTTTPSIVSNTEDSGAGSLRQAVLYANSSPGLDTIYFTDILPNQTITLSSEIVITESVTISGPTAGDAGSVILDGGGNNRHINAGGFGSNSGEIITLENITLQNGYYNGTSDIGGGSVLVRNAGLVLNNSNITNNSTMGNSVSGGGIDISGNITLNKSNISGNSTSGTNAQGGGLKIREGDATFNQSKVSGNSTTGDFASGGGLTISEGDATFNKSTLSGNSTTGEFAGGGGLTIREGDATFNQSTVSGNSTTGDSARGGGLAFDTANAILNQSTISGNDTTGTFAKGGGLYTFDTSVTLTQSTVFDNQSAFGAAGLSVRLSTGNTVNLTNSILSGNIGTGSGGNFNDSASLTSPNVTVNYSLFGDDASEITNTLNSTANIHDNNPMLISLRNNGGPTLTHHPLNSSDAIDNGSNLAAAAFDRDQRGFGFSRIDNAVVDIGAVEYASRINGSNVFTRAGIIKPLLQLAEIEPMMANNPYSDVANNSLNADWIETFKAEGFAQGCNVNRFCPNEVLTKGKLAQMIKNVKNLPLLSYQGLYSDVPVTHPYALEIEALGTPGSATECAAGRYCPNEAVTRFKGNFIMITIFDPEDF